MRPLGISGTSGTSVSSGRTVVKVPNGPLAPSNAQALKSHWLASYDEDGALKVCPACVQPPRAKHGCRCLADGAWLHASAAAMELMALLPASVWRAASACRSGPGLIGLSQVAC